MNADKFKTLATIIESGGGVHSYEETHDVIYFHLRKPVSAAANKLALSTGFIAREATLKSTFGIDRHPSKSYPEEPEWYAAAQAYIQLIS